MRGWKLSTAHLGILLLPSGVFLDAFLDHLFLILVELYDLVELLTSNLLSAGLPPGPGREDGSGWIVVANAAPSPM